MPVHGWPGTAAESGLTHLSTGTRLRVCGLSIWADKDQWQDEHENLQPLLWTRISPFVTSVNRGFHNTSSHDSILQSFQCLRSAKYHNPLLPKNPPQKQSKQPKPYCKYQVSAIFLGSVQMEVNKLPAAQEKKGNSPDRRTMTALLNESLQLVRETSFSSRIHTLLTHTDKEISSRCPNYFCNRREYLHRCWKNPKYRKRAEDKTTHSDSDLSQF